MQFGAYEHEAEYGNAVYSLNSYYTSSGSLFTNLSVFITRTSATAFNYKVKSGTDNYYKATVSDIGTRISVLAYPKTSTFLNGTTYWNSDKFYSNDISVFKEQVAVKGPYTVTFTEPVGGMTANFSANLTSNSDCKLNPATTSGTGLTYMNMTTGQPVNKGDTFRKGNTYRAIIDLIINRTSAQYEYIFDKDTKVYLNGKAATVKVRYTETGLDATMDFTITSEVNTIKSAAITLTEPVAGAKPSFTVSKNTTACDFYTGLGLLSPNGTGLEFIDHSKGEPTAALDDIKLYMAKDDTFKAGQKYTARVFLTTMDKTDTYFDKSFSATVNGKAANASDTSGGKETLIWVDYTFTLSGGSGSSYLVGDVNSDGAVNGADAGLLSRYAAGWKDYDKKIKNMKVKAADVNGDGNVNGADAGILSRHTSGWSNYAKYFVTKTG